LYAFIPSEILFHIGLLSDIATATSSVLGAEISAFSFAISPINASWSASNFANLSGSSVVVVGTTSSTTGATVSRVSSTLTSSSTIGVSDSPSTFSSTTASCSGVTSFVDTTTPPSTT